jgi:hypothetical protein
MATYTGTFTIENGEDVKTVLNGGTPAPQTAFPVAFELTDEDELLVEGGFQYVLCATGTNQWPVPYSGSTRNSVPKLIITEPPKDPPARYIIRVPEGVSGIRG